MKFVDEATIKVQAGNGGRGMVSFRREKFMPFGGPDGGDGGDGGHVYLVAKAGLNTLADFRHMRTFKAVNGEPGGSADCSGRGGADIGSVRARRHGDLRRRYRGNARRPRCRRRPDPRRERRRGRHGQPALQEQHQPHAAQGDAGQSRREARVADRTQAAGRRRPARPAERGQVHPDQRGVVGHGRRLRTIRSPRCTRTSASSTWASTRASSWPTFRA